MNAELRWALVAVITVLGFYFLIAALTEPYCPQGSTPKLTRSGWYCTVPPVHGFRG